MRRGEQFGQFDAQPGEVVDVEKPAVVDLLGGDPPAGEAIGLRFEEPMQAAEAGRPAGPPGEGEERRRNRRDDAWIGDGRRQLPFQFRGTIPRLGGAEPPKRREINREARQHRPTMLQDGRIVERRYRKAVIVVPGAETPFGRFEAQHDLAALQYRAVLLAEHRQQYPAFQIFAQWVPIDVEIRRIGRKFAPFENIEPPGIVGAAHCHMVRHDIEDEPHPLRLNGGGERSKFALRAGLRVQPVVIDDVIAVGRAGARLH